MRKPDVVKVVYYYENGASVDFTREHTHEKYMRGGIPWARECRRTEFEQQEYDAEIQSIMTRLNNVDPAIFPENLFKNE